MASLEYVTAGWLRSRRLTVASVGAGRGCGGLCPRPLPRQGGELGLGDFFHTQPQAVLSTCHFFKRKAYICYENQQTLTRAPCGHHATIFSG